MTNTLRLLSIAKALTQKAGARHSSKDTDMVQRMHDLACELGAKCDVKKATGDYFSKPAMKAGVLDALVLRHPGHGNQKTHGNRFGAGQAKESLRRLKDDKEAREKYKDTARGRGQGSGAGKESDTPWYGKEKTAKPKADKATKKPVTQEDLTPSDRGTLSALANSHKSTKEGEKFLIGPASILSEEIGFKAYDKDQAKIWQQVVDKQLVKEHPVIPGKTSRYTLSDLGKQFVK